MASTERSQSYFIVMIDYGRLGLEAVVHPEDTRRNVIDYIREKLGDDLEIPFIHHVHDGSVEDVTEELMQVARAFQMEEA